MNISLLNLKQIALVIASALCVLARGGARKKVRSPQYIVIVQNAKLGDMVCTTPVFRAIKKAYPRAHLTVVGNSSNKELLAGNPDVDEYITRDDSFLRALRQVRKRRYDFGAIMTPDARGLSLLFLGGVRSVSVPIVSGGYSPHETHSYRFLRTFAFREQHVMGSYGPREYLKLLRPLSVETADTTKYIFFSTEGVGRAEKLLEPLLRRGYFLVGIAPAAGNRIKEWFPERFAKFANEIARKHNAAIIIIGGKGDRGHAEKMKQYLAKETPVFDTTGILSIDELKAFIVCLNMFVSVDTGPIYIAEALGIPTIDIVGPMDEREQPPQGRYHRIVAPPGRKQPQLQLLNARVYDREEVKRQIDSISVEMVVAEASDLIYDIKNSYYVPRVKSFDETKWVKYNK